MQLWRVQKPATQRLLHDESVQTRCAIGSHAKQHQGQKTRPRSHLIGPIRFFPLQSMPEQAALNEEHDMVEYARRASAISVH